MGRRPVEIDKNELVRVLKNLESTRNFNGQTELWQAVAAELKVSITTVLSRAKIWNISPEKTQSRRGMGGGLEKFRAESVSLPPTNRVSRSEKIQKDPEGQKWIDALRNTPELSKGHAKSLVDKAEEGSLMACLALKCMECTVGDREEIRNCVCVDCPLFFYRPYKNKDTEENLEQNHNEDSICLPINNISRDSALINI